MSRVPIACTLTDDDATARIEEWRVFLREHTLDVQLADTSAALTLAPGTEALLRCVDLVEREKACCAFFVFSLSFEDGRRRLTIGVPEDAAPVLGTLVALRTPDRSVVRP